MRTLRWIAGIIVLVFFASCDRYDLELYYNGAADVDISYDWLSRFGEHPEGMTLLIAHDGDSIGYADISNEVDRTQMPLLSGEHRLTAMNRSFSEYSTMNFYQRNSHDGLFAQSNMWIVRSAYAWDDGTRYLEEPEYIGVATDTIVIPKTIDDLVFYDYRGHAEADTLHESRKEVIMPMTTTLHISCRVVNIQYMRSVEGFITGMADGFLLNHVWRRTETGLLKLSNWTTDSIIHIDVQTFGLPHGRELLQQRQPEHNYLRLHFTLIDGSSMDLSLIHISEPTRPY